VLALSLFVKLEPGRGAFRIAETMAGDASLE
jgi:hypothetical protein